MPISRRDFINGAGATMAGGLLPGTALTNDGVTEADQDGRGYNPPTLTGSRGNHEGSFEVARARTRNHPTWTSPILTRAPMPTWTARLNQGLRAVDELIKL